MASDSTMSATTACHRSRRDTRARTRLRRSRVVPQQHCSPKRVGPADVLRVGGGPTSRRTGCVQTIADAHGFAEAGATDAATVLRHLRHGAAEEGQVGLGTHQLVAQGDVVGLAALDLVDELLLQALAKLCTSNHSHTVNGHPP